MSAAPPPVPLSPAKTPVTDTDLFVTHTSHFTYCGQQISIHLVGSRARLLMKTVVFDLLHHSRLPVILACNILGL